MEIIQPNIYRILPRVIQVIYTLDSLYAKYDPTSSGYPDILFTRFNRFTMHKLENGDNSAKYSQNFTKS